MKNILYSFLLLLSLGVNAQIGVGVAKAEPTAIIDFSSTKKGFLIPRMTTDERNAIGKPGKPATGLQVYDTDLKSLWYYNGTAWTNTSYSIVDASTTAKGILKLAGDLTGSADAPVIGANTVTGDKILNETIENDDLKNSTGGIYNGDGSLSGNTVVNGNGRTLTFTSNIANAFSVDGTTFSIDAANNAVGIGTATPNSKAILDLTSTTKGILPPRMTTTQRDAISPATAHAGLTIYNTTTNSLEVWNGGSWGTLAAPLTGTITTLSCGSATTNRPLIKNESADGSTLFVPYSGGTVGTYDGQSINSTGVTGLTATLNRGTFAASGSLSFALTGTPTSSGIASFSLNLGGQSCIVNLTINGTIGTLNCSAVTHTGTLYKNITPSGVTITIPYTGGDGSAYVMQSFNSTDVTGLTATLSAGNSRTGEGNLTFTIGGSPTATGTATFIISIGGQTCTLTRTVLPSIASINCGSASHNGGTMNNGIAVLGGGVVNTVIPYTGGDGSPYETQSFPSTGVTGLTAKLRAANYAIGNGTATFDIEGTPTSGGSATFAITLGGRSCSFTRTVNIMPASITLGQAYGYFITSVFDENYAPYALPGAAATTSTPNPADITPDPTLNIQGTLSTTGVTVMIPYTVAGVPGTLPPYSQTVTIPATLTEDGVAVDVQFSYESQNLAIGKGVINATLKSLNKTLNVKKLDVQNGIGNDNLGVLLANFTYPYNTSGSFYPYQLRATAPIPDRNTDNNHRFFYSPVFAFDGRIWLANNLGAGYADITKAEFDPAKQPTTLKDHLGYGSLFQWGRFSDGHELINWEKSGNIITGTPKFGWTTTKSTTDTPVSTSFIGNTVDWRSTYNNNLWVAESNNPCPINYRVPTAPELTTVISAEQITSLDRALKCNLHLSLTGKRESYYNTASNFAEENKTGFLWSSKTSNSENISGVLLYMASYTVEVLDNTRFNKADGLNVRCIKK